MQHVRVLGSMGTGGQGQGSSSAPVPTPEGLPHGHWGGPAAHLTPFTHHSFLYWTNSPHLPLSSLGVHQEPPLCFCLLEFVSHLASCEFPVLSGVWAWALPMLQLTSLSTLSQSSLRAGQPSPGCSLTSRCHLQPLPLLAVGEEGFGTSALKNGCSKCLQERSGTTGLINGQIIS